MLRFILNLFNTLCRVQDDKGIEKLGWRLNECGLGQDFFERRKHAYHYPFNLGWTEVQTLNCSRNLLTKLGESWLSDLRLLEEADFSDNLIVSIPGGTFGSLSHLQVLHLERNKLTVLVDDCFRGLSSLSRLFLQENQIVVVTNFAMTGLPELKYLNMADNRVDLKRFSSSKTRGSPIAHRSPFWNSTLLEHIDLSRNQISTQFADWKTVKNLKQLNLSYNKFEIVRYSYFARFCSTFAQVDLHYNNISRFAPHDNLT